MIIGDRGKIKLADPFYRPYQISLTKYPDIITTGVEQKTHSQKKLIDTLKQNSLIQSFLIKLKNFLAQKATQTIFSPPQGNGYQYEAIEVMQCLRNGQLESQIMPLDETVKIMEWMDKIRDQWH
jgi:hypothetical protein